MAKNGRERARTTPKNSWRIRGVARKRKSGDATGRRKNQCTAEPPATRTPRSEKADRESRVVEVCKKRGGKAKNAKDSRQLPPQRKDIKGQARPAK